MFEATQESEERERLLTGHSGRLVIALSFGWLVGNLGRQVLPPLLPTIIDELSITPSQAGFSITLLWGFYAFSSIPGGRFSDYLSRKTVVVASLGVAIVGLMVLSTVTAYPAFLLGVALVDVGVGSYYVAMWANPSDLFIQKRGQAFGLNAAFEMTGGALAAGLALVALCVATWQMAFVPLVASLVAIVFLLHRWIQDSYVVSRVPLDIRGTGARVFATAQVRWLVAAFALVSFTFQAILGFLPTFLEVEKGFPPLFAGASFALVFVIGIVVMPVAGNLSDHRGRIPVATGALVLGMLGLGSLVVASSMPLTVVGLVLFALGLWVFSPGDANTSHGRLPGC